MESDVAILGCGFSGCMTLANLVRLATRPLHITVIDGSGHAPLGVAYATTRAEHLLNVPANHMGAFADQPQGFYEWLQANGHALPASAFAPRMLYGQYLQGIFDEALRLAPTKNIHITRINAPIVDATPTTLIAATGERIAPKAIALCTGHQFAPFAASGVRYITDVWNADERLLAACAGDGQPVLLIGTGLTAVDVLGSLEKRGWRGGIIAMSRHAAFPRPHCDAIAPEWKTKRWETMAHNQNLSALLGAIRQEIAEAGAQGAPWQAVLDSLRPHTVRLWRQLPAAEQKRMLGRYLSRWNIYRHRMPADAARMIDIMRQEGRLILCKGSVRRVTEHKTGVEVRYADGAKEAVITASLVFDCTGPRYGTLPPLAQTLVQCGLATPAANGTGVAVDARMKAQSAGSLPVYVVGSLAAGSVLESTAVRELREQARMVAEALAV